MNITIKGTHMDLTGAIRVHVEEKIRMLEKFIDPNDTSAHAAVEVGTTSTHHKHGSIFRAEINLHTRRGDFRAVSKEEDIYTAIDVAKAEMAKQLKRDKDKHTRVDRKRGNIFKRLFKSR